MRIYQNFQEALREIHRDLSEMGVEIHTSTYQDKDISQDEGMKTQEITDYGYRVIKPEYEDIKLKLPEGNFLEPHMDWCDAEWYERQEGCKGMFENPGHAWLHRKEVWEQFIQDDGTFAYTYSERLARHGQVQNVIEALKKDPNSRQAFVGIWNPADSNYLGGVSRVPCTLGYHFQIRNGLLNIHYIQRSADFFTHFLHDILLAHMLQQYISGQIGVEIGTYTHTIFSLHIFMKDTKGVF